MNTVELLAIIKDLSEAYGYALTRLMKLSGSDRVILSRLVRRGLIKRVGRGRYVITRQGIEYLKKNSSYFIEYQNL